MGSPSNALNRTARIDHIDEIVKFKMFSNRSIFRLFNGAQTLSRKMLSSAVSPSLLESQASLAQIAAFNPGLVIFDKDGTLVCFHTMWNSWCEQLATRMKAETEKEVASELYSMLGYDSQNKRVRMGMLAEKTHPYIKEKVEEMLITEYKFNDWEAKNVMEKNLERHSGEHADQDDRKPWSYLRESKKSRSKDCHLHLGLERRNGGVPLSSVLRLLCGPRSLW